VRKPQLQSGIAQTNLLAEARGAVAALIEKRQKLIAFLVAIPLALGLVHPSSLTEISQLGRGRFSSAYRSMANSAASSRLILLSRSLGIHLTNSRLSEDDALKKSATSSFAPLCCSAAHRSAERRCLNCFRLREYTGQLSRDCDLNRYIFS